ncbi:MAG: fluoride efflux transporter CrcB, partial [Leptospirillum sp.]
MLRTMTIIACFAVAGAWARYGQTLLIQKLLGRNFPW